MTIMRQGPETSIVQRREICDFLDQVGSADIVVGIPSYNNARTIGHVTSAALAGLAKYFPDRRSVVLNSDGGSSDGTPEVVRGAGAVDGRLLLLSHPMFPAHRLSVPYLGIAG